MAARSSSALPLTVFLRLFAVRHAWRERLQMGLLLAILALGVGTFLSIRIANRAAVEGFQLFTESLQGPSDRIIETPGGRLPLADLPALREALGGLSVYLFPVLESSLLPLQEGEESPTTSTSPARILGLDLVQFRSLAAANGEESGDAPDWLKDDEAFWDVVENQRHLLLVPSLAEEWGLRVGDEVAIILRGEEQTLRLAGLLPEVRGDQALPDNLAVMDLPVLAKRLGIAAVDRVELIVAPGPRRETLLAEADRRLRGATSRNWRVLSPEDREAEGAAMTAAFRLNLTVLSLIALLTGLYLIAQTLDATVSRRRGEIATLRSLGITSREIQRLWLAEALFYSAVAGFLGLLAGYGMAWFTVDAVTGTVRALYRETATSSVKLTAGDLLLTFGISLGGGLVAAWLPARDAAQTPPAQQLRLSRRIPPFPVFQHPWIGVFALLLGTVLAFLPPYTAAGGAQMPVAGYATAFLYLVGGTLLAVQGLQWTGRLLHRLGRNRPTVALGSSRLRAPTSRHQLALSGFFVAITMAASMTFLIQSFESTITGWLQQRLQGDLFLSSVGFRGNESDQRMRAEVLTAIESREEVAILDRSRSVSLPLAGRPARLTGLPLRRTTTEKLLLLEGPGEQTTPEGSFPAYANESLARRMDLSPGDTVTIPTPSGPRNLFIRGVHADYSSDNGQLIVDLPPFLEWFRIEAFDTAAVYTVEGTDLRALQEELQAAYPGLVIRRNSELLRDALSLFHQTFAVTKALQAIALLVALVGLSLSLISLLRETGREIALQRTLGMSRHEIARASAVEGLGVALTGLVSGLLMGGALGIVLIHVINRQSFGWTLDTAYSFTDAGVLTLAVLGLSFVISYLTTLLFLRTWEPATAL